MTLERVVDAVGTTLKYDTLSPPETAILCKKQLKDFFICNISDKTFLFVT
jgi:hypothetical protein